MNAPKRIPHSDLKPGQQATLFPSLGFYDERRGAWRVLVHGRVFRGGRIPLGTRILLGGLKKAMKASPEQVASETFQKRIGGFLAAPGKRRRIVLQLAGRTYRLRRRTRSNGAFYASLTLSKQAGDAASGATTSIPDSSHETLQVQLKAPNASDNVLGKIFLVPPEGVSIISDIDDTIKYTDATDRSEMLANTFLRPFEVIAGMPELYEQWKQAGCHFHYVSSSPWQLYQPLAELCEESKFPSGSMHLKYFRLRDEMFKRFRPLRRNSKVGIIAGILKRLPQRKFILVGDSGEKDPEIYRFLARRFPTQVRGLLIRDLDARPLDNRRKRKLSTIPNTTELRIFTRSEEVADIVESIGG